VIEVLGNNKSNWYKWQEAAEFNKWWCNAIMSTVTDTKALPDTDESQR
jgi:hypothetical protein